MYPIFNELCQTLLKLLANSTHTHTHTHTQPMFYARSKTARVMQLYVYADLVHFSCLERTKALPMDNPTSKRSYQISVNTEYHNLSQLKRTLLTGQTAYSVKGRGFVKDVTYNSYRKAQTLYVKFLQYSTSPL